MDEAVRMRKEPEEVEGTRAALRDVTDMMESSVLNGSVVVRSAKAINYPDFLYRPNGWKSELQLMNASSMVSEMTPLILYLRYVVDEGQTLIIEEPKSHLHPKMQIQLTRLLALLVQAGIKVIVTTHSDWVVSCLNNIVLRKRNESASSRRLTYWPERRRCGAGVERVRRRRLGVFKIRCKVGIKSGAAEFFRIGTLQT